MLSAGDCRYLWRLASTAQKVASKHSVARGAVVAPASAQIEAINDPSHYACEEDDGDNFPILQQVGPVQCSCGDESHKHGDLYGVQSQTGRVLSVRPVRREPTVARRTSVSVSAQTRDSSLDCL